MTKYEVFHPDMRHFPEARDLDAVFFECDSERELMEKIAEHERTARRPAIPYDLMIITHHPTDPAKNTIGSIMRMPDGYHVIGNDGGMHRAPILAVEVG